MEIEQMYFQIDFSIGRHAVSQYRLKVVPHVINDYIKQLIKISEGKKVVLNIPLINGEGDYYKLDLKKAIENLSSLTGENVKKTYTELLEAQRTLGFKEVQGKDNGEVLFFTSKDHHGFYAGVGGLWRMSWIVEYLSNRLSSYPKFGIALPFHNIIEVSILVKDVVFLSQGLSVDLFNSILEFIEYERGKVMYNPKRYDQLLPHFKTPITISRNFLLSKGLKSERNVRALTPRFMMINLLLPVGIREILLIFLDNIMVFFEKFQKTHKMLLNNKKLEIEGITKMDYRTEDEMDIWIRSLGNVMRRISTIV